MRRKISKFTLICVLVIGLASCISDGEPGLFPQPTPTSTVDISSSSYMSGCFLLNPVRFQKQVGYQGIYPGKSNKLEVIETFGIPTNTSTDFNGIETILYNGYQVAIRNNTVYSVNDNTQEYLLENMISSYGCPDLILTGLNPEDIPITLFVYLNLGIYLNTFSELPLTLESSMYITYFEPTTLNEYLSSGFVKYIGDIRIISWYEAIK